MISRQEAPPALRRAPAKPRHSPYAYVALSVEEARMLRHALERATRRANCLAAFCAAALIMLVGMMAYLIAAVR